MDFTWSGSGWPPVVPPWSKTLKVRSLHFWDFFLMLKLLQNVACVYRVLLCKHEQSATMISTTEILLQCYTRVPLLMLDELEKMLNVLFFCWRQRHDFYIFLQTNWDFLHMTFFLLHVTSLCQLRILVVAGMEIWHEVMIVDLAVNAHIRPKLAHSNPVCGTRMSNDLRRPSRINHNSTSMAGNLYPSRTCLFLFKSETKKTVLQI
jgi:hypothetical protein